MKLIIRNKSIFVIASTLFLIFFLSACSSEKDTNDDMQLPSQQREQEIASDNTMDDIENGKSPFANAELLETDSEWVEDKLYVLAANEIGVERLENCAADATTVKYLITEADETNAWLIQYAILYRMDEQGYDNMEVKFVFYKESGDVGTKYLQTSYSIETLKQIDLEEMTTYMELQEFAQ